MDNEFKFIERIEQGKTSLVGIIDANRWMEREMAKRKRTQKIALLVLAVVFGAVALYVAFTMLNPRSSRVDKDFAMILGIALLAMVMLFGAILIFGIRSSTTKPYKRYKQALQESFPGLDASRESSIKNYVWSYTDRPNLMLANLYRLMLREADQRRIRGATGDVYTSAERVFMDVWQTDNAAEILLDWDREGERVIDHLMSVVDSFRTIGADNEAYVWTKMIQLLTQMELCKRNQTESKVLAYEHPDDDGLYVYTQEQKEQLFEIEEHLAACRPETEQKLFEYVLAHKKEFVFGPAPKQVHP